MVPQGQVRCSPREASLVGLRAMWEKPEADPFVFSKHLTGRSKASATPSCLLLQSFWPPGAGDGGSSAAETMGGGAPFSLHAAHGRQLKRRSQRHGFQSGRGKMGPRRGWLDQTAAFNPEKHQQWRPGRVLAGRTGQSDENVATCQKTLGQRPSDIGNKVKLQACSATILRLFPLQAKVWGAGTALLPLPGCASQGSRRPVVAHLGIGMHLAACGRGAREHSGTEREVPQGRAGGGPPGRSLAIGI